MIHSISYRSDIDDQSYGLQSEMVQEQESLTFKANSEIQTFSVRQMFVVEWQMHILDAKHFHQKEVKNEL